MKFPFSTRKRYSIQRQRGNKIFRTKKIFEILLNILACVNSLVSIIIPRKLPGTAI